MAKVNQITQKVKIPSLEEMVKLQLLIYCHFKNIRVSDADLNCLAYLAIEGDQELTQFCIKAADKKIFSGAQSVRNCLRKAEIKHLIMKEGKNKKKIYISPDISVITIGNILLDLKYIYVDPKES